MAPVDLKRSMLGGKIAMPHALPGRVDGDDLACAEDGIDALAVGHRARAGEVVLFVDRRRRSLGRQLEGPQPASVAAGERLDEKPHAIRARRLSQARARPPLSRRRPAPASDGSPRAGGRRRPATSRRRGRPRRSALETPVPPSGVFHAMPSFSLQWSGRARSAETPVPSGPRHCGQLSPCSGMMKNNVEQAFSTALARVCRTAGFYRTRGRVALR